MKITVKPKINEKFERMNGFIDQFKQRVWAATEDSFDNLALDLFHFQAAQNPVYQKYIQLMARNPADIQTLLDIPFLPVSFFKTHQVYSAFQNSPVSFKSSGTTGQVPAIHHIGDIQWYQQCCLQNFEYFYGDIEQYIIMALTPDKILNPNSSLVAMLDYLIGKSKNSESGFYLESVDKAISIINSQSIKSEKKLILWGLTSALIDFVTQFEIRNKDLILIETGGMKGKGIELLRSDLHVFFRSKNIRTVQAEYGMTELTSQFYAIEDGRFQGPPWLKVIFRDPTDPMSFGGDYTSGGINVIDLTNVYSCAFLEIQDLGRKAVNDSFEMLGRFDHAEVRGCNLML